jgi:isocitrate dehydrogenase kinase/phosphatase
MTDKKVVFFKSAHSLRESRLYSIKYMKRYKLNQKKITEISKFLNSRLLQDKEAQLAIKNYIYTKENLSDDFLVLHVIRVFVQVNLLKKSYECLKGKLLIGSDKQVLVEFILKNKYCGYLNNMSLFEDEIFLTFKQIRALRELENNPKEKSYEIVVKYKEILRSIIMSKSTVYDNWSRSIAEFLKHMYSVIGQQLNNNLN